ncbi:MAG: glycosyltransferase [Acidobacteriia bacterium]|nr:glycosyltransferase [Terriglobia bacterium]
MEGVRNLSNALIALGHQVTIATLDAPGTYWLEGWSPSVVPLGPSFHYYRFSWRALRWLHKNAETFDVVIANGTWRFSSFAVWLALRCSSTPYFIYSHGMLDPYFRSFRWKEFKKAVFWYIIEHRVFRDARAVLFTCEEERAKARNRYYPYQVYEAVVRYGVCSPPITDAHTLSLVWERFPQVRGKTICLFLGRIHPVKNCETLIRSFANCAAANPSLHLIIAGPDEADLVNCLQNLAFSLAIRDQVTFAGPIYGDLKWALLRSADVFLSPSHIESFCVAMVEALACGTPVVISDGIGVWREVEQSQAGFVGSDTVEGFTAALAQWLTLTSAERGIMRIRAQECFSNYFNSSSAAQSLLQTLQHCGVNGQ